MVCPVLIFRRTHGEKFLGMEEGYIEAEQKALRINLDPTIYGTFAEIGAGQEVARFFFQAGAAAGTIAKTMSAYDKTYSDEIYGAEPTGRYVCESRLYKMLTHEFDLLLNRLGPIKPDTRFFAFADTVSAVNFAKTVSGDGWLGVRFQLKPGAPSNDLILHVKMFDKSPSQQYEAVGLLGVNMLYACYYFSHDIDQLIKSLNPGLEKRLMIDMVRLSGPDFDHIDQRSLTFKVVRYGLSDVAMFDKEGINIHPSEFLYRKYVLLVRGAFRPITHASYAIVAAAHRQFVADEQLAESDLMILCEITLDTLAETGELSETDFLERAMALNHMGLKVVLTKGGGQQNLIRYLEVFKVPKIGVALTAGFTANYFDEIIEKYRGGKLLLGLTGLFTGSVRVYVYPSRIPVTNELMNARGIRIDPEMTYLYEHLLVTRQIVDIEEYDKNVLKISARKVLKMIGNNDSGWEKYVPEKISQLIKQKKLFGFSGSKNKNKND